MPATEEELVFDNFIGGRWIAPAKDQYLVMPRHSSGVRACRVPRSSAEDVDLALDRAQRARQGWSRLDSEERADDLARLADSVGDQGLLLGLADCWERGESAFALSQKATDAVFESLTNPVYRQLAEFEASIRNCPPSAGESKVVKLAFAAETEVDAMCRRVVPLLLDGHVVVAALIYRGVRRLPVRLLALMGVMAACLPAGVLNLVTGLGLEAGVALVSSPQAIPSSEPISPIVRTRHIATDLHRKRGI